MKKPFIVFFVVLIVIGILGYFIAFRPYQSIKAKGMVIVASAKELKTTLSKNNMDLLNAQYDDFMKKYADFKKESGKVYWAAFIPYVADFKNGVEAGDYLVHAGKEGLTAITPYADLIGFKKGEISFIEKSAEDRLQTAVLTLEKVLGKVDVISENIDQAQKRIDKIDAYRYPEQIGKTKVRGTILNVKEQFMGLSSLFVDAKPLLKRIPELFGKDKEKTYLILFQNDKELRATGGFLTAYAIFKVQNGKMKIERSDDIYTLDDSIAVHPVAPREILTYHKNVSQFYIRDSNLSPDFPTSISLFNSLFNKSNRSIKYDGVITIDSQVLVDMLTIFGDTQADGITFSAKIDKRCNCPNVIYQLFDMVDRPVGYVKTNRKGILGDLMYALFYKAIGFSPSKYWGTLVQQMFGNLQQKHILVYFTDPDLENAIDKLNFGGRVKDAKGDYLYVNNVNFAGAKSNMYVNVTVNSQTKTNDSGKILRDVQIVYKNPYPHSNCSLDGGLCLNATLRNWIRVYVPKGSQLISFAGSLKKTQTYDELGKTVFEGYLEVPTEGLAEVRLKYTLPTTINANSYDILIQKQPGTEHDKAKIEVDGKTLFNAVLDVDKYLKMK
ncbi:MAG: DUF4012 domain-containing protein [bacterium]|nr:DUF4012 domain-containing protein [bacterium]